MDDLDRKRELAAALRRHESLQLRECFDPMVPSSRPTPVQEQVLREITDFLFLYVQGGNQSGKTQLGARTAAWLLQGYHPYWDYRKEFGDEPLLLILVGRLNSQVEEIWERKVKPFLQPHQWRENRQGGTLQYVVNPTNKHKLIFATHNSPQEAREKLQSYTAHFVWLDELTDHLGIIEELQRRVQAKRGRMLLTYTPKIRAEAVRRFLETPTPYSRIYRISMLDNPVYNNRRDELMSQISSLPKAQQDTILYGEWYIGEQAVFSFDPERHISVPQGYSVLWPHVVSVDPAASGLMGFTLWAAPHQHALTWWCVKSEYIKGAAPSDLVELVEKKVEHVQVLFRVFDSHEAWYGKTAAKMKISYRGVMNKHGRKKDLIAQLNQALSTGRIRLTTESADLASELSTAQWSETAEDKIVRASSYHLADTAQYFVDMIPVFKDITPVHKTHDEWLHAQNQVRKQNDLKRDGRLQGKKQTWRIMARKGTVWKRSA